MVGKIEIKKDATQTGEIRRKSTLPSGVKKPSFKKGEMKPIIISTDLIQSTLDGRKTMTRRLKGLKEINENPDNYIFVRKCHSSNLYEFIDRSIPLEFDNMVLIKCPYAVGDKLWVRETFQMDVNNKPIYKAEFGDSEIMSWKSPYHMFKKDSRINLEVIAVRYERLQEIRVKDILKEGFNKLNLPTEIDGYIEDFSKAREWWIKLWNKLNKKRGYGWEGNWWVCVNEFKLVE